MGRPTIENALAQLVNVVVGNAIREGQYLGNQLGHTHFIYTQVRIRRNDRAATEIDSFS